MITVQEEDKRRDQMKEKIFICGLPEEAEKVWRKETTPASGRLLSLGFHNIRPNWSSVLYHQPSDYSLGSLALRPVDFSFQLWPSDIRSSCLSS